MLKCLVFGTCPVFLYIQEQSIIKGRLVLDFKMNRDAIASALQPTVDPLRYRKKIVPTDTNTSHVQIVDKIPSGSRVLDVGCACGDLGVFLKEHKQCSIWGIEYDPKSLKVALDTGAYEQVVQIAFAVQKLGSLMRSHLFIFVLISIAWETDLRRH